MKTPAQPPGRGAGGGKRPTKHMGASGYPSLLQSRGGTGSHYQTSSQQHSPQRGYHGRYPPKQDMHEGYYEGANDEEGEGQNDDYYYYYGEEEHEYLDQGDNEERHEEHKVDVSPSRQQNSYPSKYGPGISHQQQAQPLPQQQSQQQYQSTDPNKKHSEVHSSQRSPEKLPRAQNQHVSPSRNQIAIPTEIQAHPVIPIPGHSVPAQPVIPRHPPHFLPIFEDTGDSGGYSGDAYHSPNYQQVSQVQPPPRPLVMLPNIDSPVNMNYRQYSHFQPRSPVDRFSSAIGGFYTPQAQNYGVRTFGGGDNSAKNSLSIPAQAVFYTPTSKPPPSAGFSTLVEKVIRKGPSQSAEGQEH